MYSECVTRSIVNSGVWPLSYNRRSLCLSLLQVNFVRVYARVTFIFRRDSARCSLGLLVVKLVPLGGQGSGHLILTLCIMSVDV